jgi:hypothetical protein
MRKDHGAAACLHLVCLLSLLSMTSCAVSRSTAPHAAASATHVTANSAPYTNATLGFSLEPPVGWIVQPQPGRQGSISTSGVILIAPDQATAHRLVQISVIEGAAMASDFARRGPATTQIGSYPAFSDDRHPGEARVPCLVRVFLAANDYVVATWCSLDAAHQVQEFERLLATYRPAARGFVPHPAPAPLTQTCAQIQSAFGYPNGVSWGRQLSAPGATAPAGGWNRLAPGVSLCSNTGSVDQYLFQCTELVNRYLDEQWALPHLPGNAARYLDYDQDGVRHPGVVRDLPASIAQIADDASQGKSAFAPQAGDLLVFQDVRDARLGWTSGLTESPGHVALMTSVTATQVVVAQENYNDQQYFEALSLTHDAHGYHIADRSGLPARITRGWIHVSLASTGAR